MATRTVHDCDRCGQEGITPVSVRLVVGRECDPSGNGYVDDDRSFDLCGSCAAWAFGRVAVQLSYEQAEEVAKAIRLRKAKGGYRPL